MSLVRPKFMIVIIAPSGKEYNISSYLYYYLAEKYLTFTFLKREDRLSGFLNSIQTFNSNLLILFNDCESMGHFKIWPISWDLPFKVLNL